MRQFFALAFILFIAAPAFGQPRSLAQTEAAVVGGVLLAPAAHEGAVTGVGGLWIQRTWQVGSAVHFGVRQTLEVTSVPFGNNDGEPTPFMRSDFNPNVFDYKVTVLPSTAMIGSIWLGSAAAFDATLGIFNLISPSMGLLSFLPAPAGSLGVAVTIEEAPTHVSVRAQLDALLLAYYKGPSLYLLPQLGLVWRL